MESKVFEVARNMGTLVQMIQKYYEKKATSAVLAARLGVDIECFPPRERLGRHSNDQTSQLIVRGD
jgi:hypothetical protein